MQNSLPSRALAATLAVLAAVAIVLLGVPPAAAGSRDVDRGWPFAAMDVPSDRPTGNGVRVAIIDSGVDVDHPAFAGRVAGAVDCTGTDGDPSRCRDGAADDNGHGTHIAGIVAAAPGPGRGAGVAPGAEILAVRALHNSCEGGDCKAIGEVDDVVAAIRWAIARDADLVNLSIDAGVDLDWGDGDLADAVARAWEAGSLVVASAGNRSVTIDDPDLRGVPLVVVGALDPAGDRADYSNLPGTARYALMAPGGEPGGACPGGGILSTFPRELEAAGTGCLSGTSMAAGYVTGALASVMATGVDTRDALARLLSSASPTRAGVPPAVDLAAALDRPAAAQDRERLREPSARIAHDGRASAALGWTDVDLLQTRVVGGLAVAAGVLIVLRSRNRALPGW